VPTDEPKEDIIERLIRLAGAAHARGLLAPSIGYLHAAFDTASRLGVKSAGEFSQLRARLTNELVAAHMEEIGRLADAVEVADEPRLRTDLLTFNREDPPDAP
jgi:hypothetical protein